MQPRVFAVPFACSPTGKVVSITEVDRDHRAGFTCAGCGAPVVPKFYTARANHFAHSPGMVGACGETALHRYVKRLISEAEAFSLPRSDTGEVVEFIVVSAVEEAPTGDGRVADVLLTLRGKRGREHRVAVEVYVTHATDDERVRSYRGMHLPLLEIEANALASLNPAEIRRVVTSTAEHKRWVWHPLHDRIAGEREIELERVNAELRTRLQVALSDLAAARDDFASTLRSRIAEAESNGYLRARRVAAAKRRSQEKKHRNQQEALRDAYKVKLIQTREEAERLRSRCTATPDLANTLGAVIVREGDPLRVRLDVSALAGVAGLDADYVWATVSNVEQTLRPLLLDREHTASSLRHRHRPPEGI